MPHHASLMDGLKPALALSPPEPLRLSLPPEAVQVWMLPDADVKASCAALAHMLSEEERERACHYRAQAHRQRFIARCGMLRWLSARYLGCAPESLCLGRDDFGKPFWRQPAEPRLAFSVSQTPGVALLAFAWNCRLGVDVEQVTHGVDCAGVGLAVFSAAEQAALASAGQDAQAEFFRIWTRKEALLKALGTGLSEEAASYTTRQDGQQGGPGRWRAWHKGVPMTGWTLRDLAPAPGVKAALAVSRRDARVWLGTCPMSFGRA